MNHLLAIVWNPVDGISIGNFTIRFYSLMFVIAFSLGIAIMKKIFIREEEPIEKLDSLFIWMVVSVLLGARLGHVFFYDWSYYKNHLEEILLPVRFTPEFEFTGFQGLASHGAAISVIACMYFYSKNILNRPFLWVLDRIVIPVASGAIFVRLGNFFNSEIVGDQTQSIFGIKFVQDAISKNEAITTTGITNYREAYKELTTNPKYASLIESIPAKHPSQLYEAFGYVFVFALLFYMYWKTDARNKQGLLFGTFLVTLFTIRIIVESVKESQGGFENILGFMSTGQWLSVPFIIIGFYLVAKASKK
ncbi:prolipoprotein diacylglyceryl transferase [Flavobacterium columnare NBRC 100251 = ATCC 23463]|uniref:Phosphatidylglycerol--prolipoprotein diacylglyceryl transferase n=2 Tax=Flavobacterium columnare TaxID=996 RepID=G8X881_FLACA|nr:prolipoprotein diacylglyceryl transferase [Flavobacterium columnare]AEW85018.1 prolipoprotein diacylglyceryl transferase [Flavobacterium columnare ATCC 49512]AMO19365.1 prolipoprotein diacylglyceryl transferase [Flavobacterium columnare]ANO49207.1 prolipoprotein diacylglyceryl transferase [Flavobacterium columnare]APT22800.1 prolipoprotein diacylglyceryl transferase [Flavobacterium columnare]AUX17303.1 prolipoprotein diacylglyceryl transferase [Flavobacterium columnare]